MAFLFNGTCTWKDPESLMLKAALLYAKQFLFAVFPVSGKVPFKGTYGFKDASRDPVIIQRMFKQYPRANVGIATGSISNIIVIDIDPRNDGDVTWKELVPYYLAPEVATGGGGKHIYYRYQAEKMPKILGPGVDIKTDGGYIVAPPSVHPDTKKTYQWLPECHIKNMAIPLSLPPWVTEAIQQQKAVKPKRTASGPYLQDIGLQDEILALLGDWTQKGDEYKACCPVHSEQKPSFYVNFVKGTFHCFGCDFKGHVAELKQVLIDGSK